MTLPECIRQYETQWDGCFACAMTPVLRYILQDGGDPESVTARVDDVRRVIHERFFSPVAEVASECPQRMG